MIPPSCEGVAVPAEIRLVVWIDEPETSALRAFGLGLPAPAVFQHRRGSVFCVYSDFIGAPPYSR